MVQGLFNLIVSAYTIVSAITIGRLYKQVNLLSVIHKQQVEFNEEVINGFTLTRKALTNERN